jgi:uncharacterized protein (DUF362 family)
MQEGNKRITRRTLLQAGAAAALSGCGGPGGRQRIEASPAQRAGRRTGTSSVALLTVESYEQDIATPLRKLLEQMPLPNLTGKTVLIKPNMVEFRPGIPITTNPAVVAAAARVADALGAARVIVGEGPGHYRDTEFLLQASGIGPELKRLGLPFVDLNLDELEKVENRHGFTRVDHFYLPATVVRADLVVSLPKLKTHHWVGVTASMKNFFGVVPGRRYGWPKNLLHWEGIERSIIDLVRLMPPSLAIVDAVVAMEGDGPVNGTPVDSGFVAAGADLAAVDATCARAMGLDPARFAYLELAGQVVGNIAPAQIEVIGTELARLTRTFKLPETFSNPEVLARAGSGGS